MSLTAGLVDFVVPSGLDDPERVSGGNVYDRRAGDGLSGLGWVVRMCEVDVDAAARGAPELPHPSDDGVLLIDGLVANRWPDTVVAAAERAPVVVLAHMVAGTFADADPRVVGDEARVLRAARRVIATSAWTRAELVRRGILPPERVVVATPGTDDAPVATGTRDGTALLCVGVVAPHKGQDTLIDALATLGAQTWTCTMAGSAAAHPDFARRLSQLAADAGIGDRITMAGVIAPDVLREAYRHTDLLVAPSRTESYGLAIADALRRAIPVVASRVGGIPQTVAARAAILVPPDDPRALADVLGRWMADPVLRARLHENALRGRASLPHWSDTAVCLAAALAGAR